jgi:hypothetical protein
MTLTELIAEFKSISGLHNKTDAQIASMLRAAQDMAEYYIVPFMSKEYSAEITFDEETPTSSVLIDPVNIVYEDGCVLSNAAGSRSVVELIGSREFYLNVDSNNLTTTSFPSYATITQTIDDTYGIKLYTLHFSSYLAETVTLQLTGDFYASKLLEGTDSNVWSLNALYRQALFVAARWLHEIDRRNREGANDHLMALQTLIDVIRGQNSIENLQGDISRKG